MRSLGKKKTEARLRTSSALRSAGCSMVSACSCVTHRAAPLSSRDSSAARAEGSASERWPYTRTREPCSSWSQIHDIQGTATPRRSAAWAVMQPTRFSASSSEPVSVAAAQRGSP